MELTELEKGYHCPSLEDCSKCPLKKTDCIIYSKKGQKLLKDKEKKENEKK